MNIYPFKQIFMVRIIIDCVTQWNVEDAEKRQIQILWLFENIRV